MSAKTLSSKLTRLRWRLERKYGDPEPPTEFIVYWGVNESAQAEMYAALSQVLNQAEQAQFSDLWQRIAPKITYAHNDLNRYSLHALSDPELDELERWLLLLRERGASLAGRFDADRDNYDGQEDYILSFGGGALEDD
jgi:hypothetical protein